MAGIFGGEELFGETDYGLDTGTDTYGGEHSSFGTGDFIKLAATFLAYPIVMNRSSKIIAGSTRRISRGLASTIARSGASRRFSNVHKAMNAERQGAAKFARSEFQAPTIGNVVDRLPDSMWIKATKQRFADRQKSASANYFRWKEESERKLGQLGKMSPIERRAEKARMFLRENTYSKLRIVKAGGASHVKSYMKRSLAFYAADRIIGGISGHGGDRPSPFNLPGTMLDYAKFTATFYPMDAFFMGGAKVAKYGMAGVWSAGLKNRISSVKGLHGENINKGAQWFRDVVIGQTMAAGKAAHGASKKASPYSSYSEYLKPQMWLNYLRPSKVEQTYKRFQDSFTAQYKVNKAKIKALSSRRDRVSPHVDEDIADVARELGRTSSTAGARISEMDGSDAISNAFSRMLRERAQKPTVSFFEDLLGVEKAKIHKLQAKKLAKNIAKSGVFGKMAPATIEQKFTRDLYYGGPVYNLQGGGVLDLRAMTPKNLIAKAHKNIRKSNYLYGILGGLAEFPTRLGLDKGVSAYAYSGSHPRGARNTFQGEAQFIGKFTESTPEHSSLLNPGTIAPDIGETGLFLLGKHYLISGAKESARVIPINKESTYRLLRGGHGTYMSRTMGLHYGMPERRLPSVSQMSREQGWRTGIGGNAFGRIREAWHEKVLRPFEIGAGYSDSKSVFGFVKDWAYGRLTKNHSVLKLLSSESSVFNKDWMAGEAAKSLSGDTKTATLKALNTLSDFIGRASVGASESIRKRPDMFSELLGGNMEFGDVKMNLVKGLQDDKYLYDVIQSINPRKLMDNMLGRNPKVATTLNSMLGVSYKQFRNIGMETTAKGFGTAGSSISRMDEMKNWLINARILERASKGDDLAAITTKIMNASKNQGLAFIRGEEEAGIRMMSYKDKLLNDISRATSSGDDAAIKQAFNAVMATKDDLFRVANTHLGGFLSAGNVGSKVSRFQVADTFHRSVLESVSNSPYLSIPENILQRKGSALQSLFPRIPTTAIDYETGGVFKDRMKWDKREELTRAGMVPLWLADRFMRVGEFVGFSPKPDTRRSALSMFKTSMVKWPVGLAAGYTLWGATDSILDTSPVFDGTALDEGISVAAAEQLVKGNLTYASFRDATGMTAASKHLEGLMPGTVDSPLAGMVRTALPPFMLGWAGGKLGGFKGRIFGALLGSGASVTEAYLQVTSGSFYGDTGGIMSTKDKQEWREEFSGRREVPVRRGRWWELSRQDYSGKDIMYFRPNWFAKLKSQYEYTPEGLGYKSEAMLFENPPLFPNLIGAAIDPYHYERKHYLSRPYGETGGVGSEIPFVGDAVAWATSKFPSTDPFNIPLVKPTIKMHGREMARSFRSYEATMDSRNGLAPSYSPPGWLKGYEEQFEGAGLGSTQYSPGTAYPRMNAPLSSTSLGATLGNLEYKGIIEPLGLLGFGYESVTGRLIGEGGRRGLFEPDAVMENASEMNSFRRRYWDMNMGGQFGLTEFWRRLIPRRPFNTDYYNQIPNRMPSWLNTTDYYMNFTYGDPYNKIPEGLLRLPGSGYEASHNIKRTFPGSASWLGQTKASIIENMLGIGPPLDEDGFDVTSKGTYLHQVVQEQLARENLLVKAEAPVYDPWSNVSGYVDAIIRKGRQKVVVEIKTTTTEKLQEMTRPPYAHYSQANFYMKATGIYKGMILYVSRDDPRVMKSFDINYSQSRLSEDIEKLMQARGAASALREKGVGFSGQDYSHLDRLSVLADVAPYSERFKKELEVVRLQKKLGLFTEDEILRMERILEQRRMVVQKREHYPYRFKGKVLSPDEQYRNMSYNENIKAAAEYSLPERLAGAAWESFCIPEDELIETHRGFLPAMSVATNDLVRTHTGEWKAVDDIHVREKLDGEKMKSIKAGGHGVPLRTTTTHVIWTNRGWIDSGEVTKDDELLFPPVHMPEEITELVFSDYVDGLLSVDVNGTEMVRKKHSGKLSPPKIQKTQAMMRLFGYYTARGGIIGNDKSAHVLRVGFKEDLLKLDAQRTLTPLFVAFTNQSIKCNEYVKFRGPVIAQFFTAFIGTGKKIIPDEILASDDVLLKAFLKGMWLNKSWQTFRSTEPDFTYKLSRILSHLHIPHRVEDRKSGFFEVVPNSEWFEYILGMTEIEPEKDELMWWDDDGICHMKITSMRTYRAPKRLFDFTIWEDHTYSTGLYTIHNSHMDTGLHTRFLNYRTPVEDYERSKIYGREAAFWEHPSRDFIEPWTRTAFASDSLLEGAARGGFLTSVMTGSPVGFAAGTLGGAAYGGVRDLFGVESGVPGRIKKQREIESYFDKLEYMKAMRMYNLTGHEQYKRKAGETLTGLNPYNMTREGWTSMYRSIPSAERPFFSSFLNTADSGERDRILDLVPGEVGDLLDIRWGMQDGIQEHRTIKDFRESQDTASYFNEHGIPPSNWGGWSPAVHLDDVRLKTAEKEGFDAHDFGLGWKDQMQRMSVSPFTPEAIQMTKLSDFDSTVLDGENSSANKYEVQRALQVILSKFKVTGSVIIDDVPGTTSITKSGTVPTTLDVNISRREALPSPADQGLSLSPLQRTLFNA